MLFIDNSIFFSSYSLCNSVLSVILLNLNEMNENMKGHKMS